MLHLDGHVAYIGTDRRPLEAPRVLPDAHLTRDHVLWSYTGVRPLPHQASGPTGDITRRHVVQDHGRDGDRPTRGL